MSTQKCWLSFPQAEPRSKVRQLSKEGMVDRSWESCFSAASNPSDKFWPGVGQRKFVPTCVPSRATLLQSLTDFKATVEARGAMSSQSLSLKPMGNEEEPRQTIISGFIFEHMWQTPSENPGTTKPADEMSLWRVVCPTIEICSWIFPLRLVVSIRKPQVAWKQGLLSILCIPVSPESRGGRYRWY